MISALRALLESLVSAYTMRGLSYRVYTSKTFVTVRLNLYTTLDWRRRASPSNYTSTASGVWE
jgi:hypothetical protein